mgnify:CR=1 FL=1
MAVMTKVAERGEERDHRILTVQVLGEEVHVMFL